MEYRKEKIGKVCTLIQFQIIVYKNNNFDL